MRQSSPHPCPLALTAGNYSGFSSKSLGFLAWGKEQILRVLTLFHTEMANDSVGEVGSCKTI